MTNKLRISIVTPNFNGAAHLEKTILSVIGQGYENLEYIVIDGGSTDDSLKILDRYRDRIDHILSERDRGNTDAINKGFRYSSGQVMGWINSDDVLFPGSLELLNDVFSLDESVEWVVGRPVGMVESGQILTIGAPRPWSWLRFIGNDFRHIPQESSFWRRSLWERTGAGLDEYYGIASDFDLWTRFLLQALPYTLDGLVGAFRFRTTGQLSRDAGSSSTSNKYDHLAEKALNRLRGSIPASAWHLALPHLPPGLPLQDSFVPSKVDPALAAFDPPLLRASWSQQRYIISGEKPIMPIESRESVKEEIDLAFDGSRQLSWEKGPDLINHGLASLEVWFRTGVRGAHTAFNETSPPMAFVAGPVAIYDLGDLGIKVQLQFGDERFYYDLPHKEVVHLKVAINGKRHIVLSDGNILGEKESASLQAKGSDTRVILGGGFLQRRWTGKILKMVIYTRGETADDSELRAYEVVHPTADPFKAASKGAAGKASRVLSNYTSQSASLRRFRDKHKYQRCFVMGNGPSLNKMDLNKLENEVVFACNAAFLLFDRVKWRPKYYTCVDVRVLRDRASDINAMLAENPDMQAFFPSEIVLHDGSGKRFDCRTIIRPRPNVHYFNEVQNSLSSPPETMFSIDVESYVVQPYTVAITMLQLAAFMGFSPIYLIGCDTSYTVGSSVRQEGPKINGTGLLLTSTKDDDSNHFDSRYFGAGREWHNPQVEGMMMHHGWARTALEIRGTRVFNATVGGQLEVYERVAFDRLF